MGHRIIPPPDRFWKRIAKAGPDDCWLWTGPTRSTGYGQITLGWEPCSNKSRRVHSYSHRLSWMIHNGPIPEGMWVLHTCDVRQCVNPKHLFLGTSQDNHRDMVAKGRNARGEKIYTAKLTPDKVREIRQSVGTLAEVANRFGVSPSLIRFIRIGENWKHVS